MHDFTQLINKLETQAAQVTELEAAFAKMSLSKALSFNRAKSVSSKIVTLIARVKHIADKRKEAQLLAGDALNDAGYNILQEFISFAFEHEEDLIVGIIADFFGISHEDARHVPASVVYDNIIRDKVVRHFFPRALVLEARSQSDALPSVGTLPLQPIPYISQADTSKKLKNVGKRTKG